MRLAPYYSTQINHAANQDYHEKERWVQKKVEQTEDNGSHIKQDVPVNWHRHADIGSPQKCLQDNRGTCVSAVNATNTTNVKLRNEYVRSEENKR